MFEAFEQEDYKTARSFIVTDQYEAIRDAFINRTMEYWTGNTYVPVTKEAIVFLLTEDGWKFSFVEDDSLAQPSGTIRVLGQKMEDLGVQRSSIEYVPAYDPAAYYPHTEYEIVYWNTMVSGIATDNTNVVSRMNYRFAKKTYTAEGSSAEMIYDWGGENEASEGVSRLPQRGGIMQAAQMDRREWQHATVYLNWSRRLQRSKNRNKAGGSCDRSGWRLRYLQKI